MVLNHNHPAIRNAVIEAASDSFKLVHNRNGSRNGATGDELVPTMDIVHGESGTGATMGAIRLAIWFYRSR